MNTLRELWNVKRYEESTQRQTSNLINRKKKKFNKTSSSDVALFNVISIVLVFSHFIHIVEGLIEDRFALMSFLFLKHNYYYHYYHYCYYYYSVYYSICNPNHVSVCHNQYKFVFNFPPETNVICPCRTCNLPGDRPPFYQLSKGGRRSWHNDPRR